MKPGETVFTVADFVDRIVERKATTVQRENAYLQAHFGCFIRHFQTYTEAVEFCIDRATADLKNLETRTKKAQYRLRKLKQWREVAEHSGDKS